MLSKLTSFAAASALSFAGFAAMAEPSSHVTEAGTPWAQIETVEQAVTFANVQNLVARWNNIIIYAETGDEQLQMMQDSGVFAEDFTINFYLPDGTALSFEGLDNDDIRPFYNQIVNDAGQRLNLAANVEVMEFTADGARARFKYLVFANGVPSFGGENELTVTEREGRLVVTSANIHLLLAPTPQE